MYIKLLNNSQSEPLKPRELLDVSNENLNIYHNIQSVSEISTRNLILQLWLEFEKLTNYFNRFAYKKQLTV